MAADVIGYIFVCIMEKLRKNFFDRVIYIF